MHIKPNPSERLTFHIMGVKGHSAAIWRGTSAHRSPTANCSNCASLSHQYNAHVPPQHVDQLGQFVDRVQRTNRPIRVIRGSRSAAQIGIQWASASWCMLACGGNRRGVTGGRGAGRDRPDRARQRRGRAWLRPIPDRAIAGFGSVNPTVLAAGLPIEVHRPHGY
jgi:hypothetical protein